ncbi:hypothetical protein BDZ94DRAFT_1290096 [Collybia nuda]|uniref:DUF946 domain-containing protein n=1 Tax=Collybia nuda TaxID=64659 RepID=A0A9P5Y7Z2_9AGAR|nr:hypothetical protein BDZ94DRAFT_1290096 [Collybia nuda]
MSAKIEVKSVYFDIRINDDSGSGARKDLFTWKPQLPSGWFYLGPAATNTANKPSGIIVREIVPGTLGSLVDWTQVWKDSGSGNSTDYALWRAVPEKSDHIAFGGFFTRNYNKPTIDDAKGIKTLPRDLVEKVAANPEVWTDAGSGASADGAVWGISTVGHVRAIGTGAFVPVRGYNAPPSDIYALNGNQIQISADSLQIEEA